MQGNITLMVNKIRKNKKNNNNLTVLEWQTQDSTIIPVILHDFEYHTLNDYRINLI